VQEHDLSAYRKRNVEVQIGAAVADAVGVGRPGRG
jgi:hypothetical protein